MISQFVSGYFTSRIRHPQPGRLTIHNTSIFNYFFNIPKEMFRLFSKTTLNRPLLCFYLSNKLRVFFIHRQSKCQLTNTVQSKTIQSIFIMSPTVCSQYDFH